jgi:hypothetical protein
MQRLAQCFTQVATEQPPKRSEAVTHPLGVSHPHLHGRGVFLGAVGRVVCGDGVGREAEHLEPLLGRVHALLALVEERGEEGGVRGGRLQHPEEDLLRDPGDELGVAEGLVVAHVAVERGRVRQERQEVLVADAAGEGGGLERVDILCGEQLLVDAKDDGRLDRRREQHSLRALPGSAGDVVGVLPFLLGQRCPGLQAVEACERDGVGDNLVRQ